MTPDQIHLVQSSFARAARPSGSEFAAAFYRRLFELDPALRTLFRGQPERQHERFVQMLAAAVGLLVRPETLFPVLQSLGTRHAGYGVRPEHYGSFGVALIDTLAATLGDAFGPAHRAAWAQLFDTLRQEMLPPVALAG